MENDKAIILWDSQIIMDRKDPCHTGGKLRQMHECMIIDVAIPSDYNIQKKATEKMSEYVDIQIEWQRLWRRK